MSSFYRRGDCYWKAARPRGLSSWKGNSVSRQPKPGSSWQGSGGGGESLSLPRPQARGPDPSPCCWPASEVPGRHLLSPQQGDPVIGSPSFQWLPGQPLLPARSQSPLPTAPGDGHEPPGGDNKSFSFKDPLCLLCACQGGRGCTLMAIESTRTLSNPFPFWKSTQSRLL